MKKIQMIIITIMFLTIITTPVYNATSFKYDNNYKKVKLGDVENRNDVDIEPISSNYKKVTDNQNVSLQVDEESGNFAVVDKQTNYVWYSNPQDLQGEMNDLFKRVVSSPFVISYIDTGFKEQQATILDEGSEFKIKETKDGIVYNLSFLDGEITFEVDITLNDDGFMVTIPEGTITDSENYKLLTITVAPYFGTVYEDQTDGYFVFPYQNGTLLRFKASEGYSNSFIGTTSISDYEELAFPMFGGVHGVDQNGFITYVTSDDTPVKFQAKPSGFDTDYTTANFTLTYRSVYSKKIGESQTVKQVSDSYQGVYNQQYQLLNNDNANYAGIAKAYRQYLVDNQLLATNVDSEYATNLMYLMTLEDEALFGTKSFDATTYQEIAELQSQIADDNLHVRNTAVGIQEKGNDDIKFDDVNKSIGQPDQAQITEGINLFVNLGQLNQIPNFSNDSVYVNPANNKPIELMFDNLKTYAPTSSYVSQEIAKNIDKLNADYTALTIQPVLRFYDIAPQYSTYSDDGKLISDSIINSGREYTLNLGGYYYPGYYNQASGYISDFLRTSSGYSFLDEGVPFSSIVLAGSGSLFSQELNYETVDQAMILNMIEYDVYPSLQLIGGTQEDLFDIMFSESFPSLGTDEILEDAKTIESQVYKPLSIVAGQSITDNYALDNGIKITEYESGTEIVVNYTDSDYSYADDIVPANGYLVKEAK